MIAILILENFSERLRTRCRVLKNSDTHTHTHVSQSRARTQNDGLFPQLNLHREPPGGRCHLSPRLRALGPDTAGGPGRSRGAQEETSERPGGLRGGEAEKHRRAARAQFVHHPVLVIY